MLHEEPPCHHSTGSKIRAGIALFNNGRDVERLLEVTARWASLASERSAVISLRLDDLADRGEKP